MAKMQIQLFLEKAKQAPYSKTTIDELLTGINAGTFDGMEEFQGLDRMEALATNQSGYFKAKRRK